MDEQKAPLRSDNLMTNSINLDDIDEFWNGDEDDGKVATGAICHPRSFVHSVEDTSSDEDDEWSISFRKKGLPPMKKSRISAMVLSDN